eukprot:Selendium_serpulae@DN2372_c1_g1_i1.p1
MEKQPDVSIISGGAFCKAVRSKWDKIEEGSEALIKCPEGQWCRQATTTEIGIVFESRESHQAFTTLRNKGMVTTNWCVNAELWKLTGHYKYDYGKHHKKKKKKKKKKVLCVD